MRLRVNRRNRKPLSPGKLMVVAPLIGLAMLAIVAFVSIYGGDTERFIQTAELYDATIVGARQQRGRPGQRDSVEMMSYLTVQFAPPGQQMQEREFEVSGAAFNKYSAASPANPAPTQVYWSPGTPHRWQEINSVAREERSAIFVSIGFTVFGLGLIALGIFAFTKWRRGETVMFESKPEGPPPPEVVAFMQRVGIPTLHLPGQEHELAEYQAGRRPFFIGPQPVPDPEPPPPDAADHVLFDGEKPQPTDNERPPWESGGRSV